MCPYCEKQQTAFVYYFNTSDQVVPKDSPEAVQALPGFVCITPGCQKLIKGIDYFQAGDLTVGDVKP